MGKIFDWTFRETCREETDTGPVGILASYKPPWQRS